MMNVEFAPISNEITERVAKADDVEVVIVRETEIVNETEPEKSRLEIAKPYPEPNLEVVPAVTESTTDLADFLGDLPPIIVAPQNLALVRTATDTSHQSTASPVPSQPTGRMGEIAHDLERQAWVLAA